MKKAERAKTYVDRADWTVQLLSGIKRPVVVEVGVHKADYGYLTLDIVPDMIWYGVDPYTLYGRRRKIYHQNIWDGLCLKVTAKMSRRFGERFILVRKRSDEAIPYLPAKVDFVFIDGNHDYDYVIKDLRMYEPLVKKGGIMAAHDFNTGPGVAIAEHVKKYNRNIVHEDFDPCGVCWWRM